METALAGWALVKRFWPFALGLGALIAVGALYLDNKAAHADLKVAQQRVSDVIAANKSLNTALTAVSAQRVDNDAIAAAIAGKLGAIKTRETQTQTIIERAIASDPKTAAWASVAVPDSVRSALRARQVDAGTR